MAPKEDELKKNNEVVEVPLEKLTKMQEQMAELERKLEDEAGKRAGLEEIFNATAKAEGENKGVRAKRTFEPKFRTVRLRKYPVAGNIDDLDFVVGWSSRGAYQEVDRTGVSPVLVDYIDIVFLRNQKGEKGKIKAEKIKLLDLMNRGSQIHCKILEQDRKEVPVPTNEEIDVTVFDPAHGLVSTGETIDGFVTYSEIKYKVAIPGVDEPVWVDSLYCNN